jgi:hypothetical protein
VEFFRHFAAKMAKKLLTIDTPCDRMVSPVKKGFIFCAHFSAPER